MVHLLIDHYQERPGGCHAPRLKALTKPMALMLSADVERFGVRALHTLAPAHVVGGAQACSSRGAVGRRKPRRLGSNLGRKYGGWKV